MSIDDRLKTLHDIHLIWYDWYSNKIDAYESMWRIQRCLLQLDDLTIEGIEHEPEKPVQN